MGQSDRRVDVKVKVRESHRVELFRVVAQEEALEALHAKKGFPKTWRTLQA